MNRYSKFIIYVFAPLIANVLFSCSDSGVGNNLSQVKVLDSLLNVSRVDTIAQVEADALFESAKNIAYELENPYYLGRVYNSSGRMALMKKDCKMAMDSYSQAAKFFLKTDSLVCLTYAYSNMVYLHRAMGNISEAISCANIAFGYYNKVNDRSAFRYIYNNMGAIYSTIGDNKKALSCFQKALEISKIIGDEVLLANCWSNVASCYNEMGNDSLAITCYLKNIEVYQRNADTSGLLSMYCSLGKIYLQNSDLSKAQDCYMYLLKNRGAYRLAENAIVANYDMAEYYYAVNNYDSSLYFIQMAIDSGIRYGLKQVVANAYGFLSSLYHKQGESDKAYEAKLLFDKYNEELYGVQKAMAMAQAESQFIDRLENVNRNQEKIKLKVVVSLSVLCFALILFYLIKRLKNYRSRVAELQELKDELFEQKCAAEESLNEKNKEIVACSLQLVQKKEASNQLVENLVLMKDVADRETSQQLNSLLNRLRAEHKNENVWDEFELRFNNVNDKFFLNLKKTHPSLSLNERRLCSLLRLNLNTKEISSITGQSPHSVYVARTRLRKKMGLVNCDVEMFDYLHNF